jgi:hypothetical protein
MNKFHGKMKWMSNSEEPGGQNSLIIVTKTMLKAA